MKFQIPMRGNEPSTGTREPPTTGLFQIPMRGNEQSYMPDEMRNSQGFKSP